MAPFLIVFRTNENHRQHGIFGSDQFLPAKYRNWLRRSWGHVFRHDVFTRINKRIFAVPYSEQASRPNAPINVIVGAEILTWLSVNSQISSSTSAHEEICVTTDC